MVGPIEQGFDLWLVVARHKNGAAPRTLLGNEPRHHANTVNIKRVRRLVEDEKLRPLHHRLRNRETLAHAHAESRHLASVVRVEPHTPQRIAGGRLPRLAAYRGKIDQVPKGTLESRGLVETDFCEGSRKAKCVILTEAGDELCAQKIVPANKADRAAFMALGVDEQREMLRLVDKYVAALEVELELLEGEQDGK